MHGMLIECVSGVDCRIGRVAIIRQLPQIGTYPMWTLASLPPPQASLSHLDLADAWIQPLLRLQARRLRITSYLASEK